MKRDKVNKQPNSSNRDLTGSQPPSQKKSALPRSIGRILNQIQTEFSPQGEQQFVKKFRISRARTKNALRFLLLLVVVPILTHFLSKAFVVSPIVNHIRGENASRIFLNAQMEEEALRKLNNFEKKLRFQSFIDQTPLLSGEVLEKAVKQKAIDIANEFREKSNSAISNVFADFVSLITFAVLVATNRRNIATLKLFMDEIVYGLSDSAKAFFIIMFTDIFVGFHSPDGWEVIIAGFAEHLGLPANKSVIFTFIATFPVILNSIFKYWIFNYISRLSPSSLATLKEMDD